MGSACCWCEAPVPEAGDTCCLRCLEMWFAFYSLQAKIVGGTRLLILRDAEQAPKDLEQQPWYGETREGRRA